MIETVDSGIGILVLIGQASILMALGALLAQRFLGKGEKIVSWFGDRAIALAFFAALAATLGSLFYSEIRHYTPCLLCWYQRIFMYPQVIILGIAWWKSDRRVWQYSVPLSIIGGLIALLHYYEQVTLNPLAPCSTIGYSASCTESFVLRYGYITIPLMAVTAFLMILVFRWAEKRSQHR